MGRANEAVRVAALLDLQQVLVDFFDWSAGHLVDEGVGHVFIFRNGTGHLDAKALCRILKVWPISVDQMGITVAKQRAQRTHRITFKETRVEFRRHSIAKVTNN